MKANIIEIEIFNREEKVLSTISVEQINENTFRTLANELIDCRLTYKTEFVTAVNSEQKHEILRIAKKSEYTTRRFHLTPQFKESEYKLLGDEIMNQGGFWQVDFGSIATVNLPRNSTLSLDEVFRVFDFFPNEIFE